MIGGALRVESSNAGTTLFVSVPLDPHRLAPSLGYDQLRRRSAIRISLRMTTPWSSLILRPSFAKPPRSTRPRSCEWNSRVGHHHTTLARRRRVRPVDAGHQWARTHEVLASDARM